MTTYLSGSARSRSLWQELYDRSRMVEGDIQELGYQAAVAHLGRERAESIGPLSCSVNPMERYLSIVARCLDLAAVSGAPPELLSLFRDSSSPTYRRRLAAADPGLAPVPTAILEGDGENPGFRRALEHLCASGVSGVALDVSPRSGRLYPTAIPPYDLWPPPVYADDDPTQVVRISWRCVIGPSDRRVNVTKIWDISDPDDPKFDMIGSNGSIADDYEAGGIEGDAYRQRWSYQGGRPYIPVVLLGRVPDVWRLSFLTDAVKQILVKRHCTSRVFMDSGFPVRNVRGLRCGTVTSTVTGQRHSDPGPGDIVEWIATGEDQIEHWEWAPGGDPEAMTRALHADEADLLAQIGIPIDLQSGGEPLAEILRRQQRASQRYADQIRDGLFVFLRRSAALANRLGLARGLPETGFSFLLGSEVEEAITPKQPDENAERNEETEE